VTLYDAQGHELESRSAAIDRADAAEERARRLEEQLRNLGIAPATNDE
jgi:hypothetical protein